MKKVNEKISCNGIMCGSDRAGSDRLFLRRRQQPPKRRKARAHRRRRRTEGRCGQEGSARETVNINFPTAATTGALYPLGAAITNVWNTQPLAM